MADPFSDDDLPDLKTLLLPPESRPSAPINAPLRRSPRKQHVTSNPTAAGSQLVLSDFLPGVPKEIRQSASKHSPAKRTTKSTTAAKPAKPSLGQIPVLPRSETTGITLTSNNGFSPTQRQRSLKLTHVDSLLLPLSKMAMQEQKSESNGAIRATNIGSMRVLKEGEMSMMSMMTEAARRSAPRSSPRKQPTNPNYASRFVLTEARCNDLNESSGAEEDEEDTDLSGFIVDDSVELSYHDSSSSESEAEKQRQKSLAPRRRLQRGSPARRRISGDNEDAVSEKENDQDAALSHIFRDMQIDREKPGHKNHKAVEVIDLTSSPIEPPRFNLKPKVGSKLEYQLQSDPDLNGAKQTTSSNPFDSFDDILRLSPPISRAALKIPSEQGQRAEAFDMTHEKVAYPAAPSLPRGEDGFTTPPATPPPSPSKLKSPSKLFSPSKRADLPRTLHRQSTDGFWDLHAVNEWHDQYSPKKVPATSPRKQGIGRFKLWSDSDEDAGNLQSDSTPSPCNSPRKSGSPLRSPERAEKARLAIEKKVAKQRKADFDARKIQLALDLLQELDTNVTNCQISNLASTTGGVQIVWSKTLRSTAGRANWRRTMTKLSGSPIKGAVTEGPGIKVQHYANIELAEKVIDCEDRLVNTLAHEFCHLANFMVSGVRDQPHGASFKSWAHKATRHLRQTGNALWKKVEVTTKHSYEINHKYLWICAGKEKSKAVEYLNLEQEDGCGAEYGRHSRSIDVEKHRCGKCRGLLEQVRPAPRALSSPRKNKVGSRSPVKKEGSLMGSDDLKGLQSLVEVVELSD